MITETPPAADPAAILAALNVMFQPDEVLELRAISKRKKIIAGYFDPEHRAKLASEAVRLNRQHGQGASGWPGAAIYVGLNPIDPQLLGRCCNRVEPAQVTATDANVTRRRWLLVDIDPVRPAGTSATQAQLDAAREVAEACHFDLFLEDWPEPLRAESGNGYHLLYPISMPNDAESAGLVKGVLAALAARYDTPQAKIDQSVFNASRITKLYGTVSNKGDNTPLAPWRLSRLIDEPATWRSSPLTATPARGASVTAEQMRALVPPTTAKPCATSPASTGQRGAFDLAEFLGRLGIDSEQDIHEGSERFKLAHCPFNHEHGKGESAIFRQASGALGFKCLHDSCSDKKWADVRELVDGPADQRANALGDGAAGFDVIDAKIPDEEYEREVPKDGWPTVHPLPGALPPVPEFDLALLPDALRPWIQDIAERMQMAPDIPAIGAVTALSAAIGRRAQIQPKAHDDWTVVPNLWGLVVAPPGFMKSPALAEVMKPLHRLEAEAYAENEVAVAAWLGDKERVAMCNAAVRARSLAALKRDPGAELTAMAAEPEAPVATRYICNNFSMEALGEVLMTNPHGALAFSDELCGLLKMLEKTGNEGLHDFMLSAWAGDAPFTFDRVGRGLNRRIDSVCMAVLGGIQPGRLVEHVTAAASGGGGDSGLMQRFQMLTWPDLRPEWDLVDRKPDSKAKDAAYAVFERVVGRGPLVGFEDESMGPNAPDVRHFDVEAQAAFYAWLGDLEALLRGDTLPPVLLSHLSKFRSLVPALALIFAVADGTEGAVPLRYLVQAIGWAEYLRPHAERVYASALQPDVLAARALLAKIKERKVRNGFTARSVYLKGWSALDSQGVVKALLLLCDFGYLVQVDPPSTRQGGAPKVTYLINPGALSI